MIHLVPDFDPTLKKQQPFYNCLYTYVYINFSNNKRLQKTHILDLPFLVLNCFNNWFSGQFSVIFEDTFYHSDLRHMHL